MNISITIVTFSCSVFEPITLFDMFKVKYFYVKMTIFIIL